MGKVNFVQRQTGDHGYLAPIAIAPEPLPEMPPELRALFEEAYVAMADTDTGTDDGDRHRRPRPRPTPRSPCGSGGGTTRAASSPTT